MRRTATVLAILIALMLIPIGASKLTGNSATRWRERFVRWGYPAGAVLVIGLAEVAAGVGVLVPRTRIAAAAAVIAVMLGASATHLLNGEALRIIPPLVIGGMAGVVIARRSQRGSRNASA